MKTTIYQGVSVFKRFEDEPFVNQWQALVEQSPSFVAAQAPAFVSSWCKAYNQSFTPVLAVVHQDDSLLGLMACALDSDGGLIQAGGAVAEYNNVIAKAGTERVVLTQAMIAINEEVQPSSWQWEWLPCTADKSMFDAKILAEGGLYISYESCQSPMYDLHDLERLNGIKKSKSLKSKINRLKRHGELRFEKITDRSRAQQAFDQMNAQVNLRLLALYNNDDFDAQRQKAQWHIDHMEQSKEAHFTVLWLGDEVLASNFGYCSDDTILIGLFTYNPLYGMHSPGNVFLLELMAYMQTHDFRYLDLTPGGDSYKERFANQHHTLYQPVISFNQTSATIGQAKRGLTSSLKKIIKKALPINARDMANIAFLKDSNALKVLNHKLNQKLGVAYGFYDAALNDSVKHEKDSTDAGDPRAIEVKQQHYADLMAYANNDGTVPIKEVASNALRYFERGDELFSIMHNETLLFCVWRSCSAKRHPDSEINQWLEGMPKHPLLYGLHYHYGMFDAPSLSECWKALAEALEEQSQATYVYARKNYAKSLALTSAVSAVAVDSKRV